MQPLPNSSIIRRIASLSWLAKYRDRRVQFEDAMQTIGQLTQASPDELAEVATIAERLAASTSWTLREVSEFMVKRAREGYTARQLIDAAAARIGENC